MEITLNINTYNMKIYVANNEQGSPLLVIMNRLYGVTWSPIAAKADLTTHT